MIVNKYNNGGGGSASGVTPEQVQQQIDSALTPFWESGETKDYVDEAVSGKADAKIMVDFDHTSQSERAALYATLKALYDGGSGATINKNYDFYKTVNTWQGQKIDYYTFSADTLVFGQVVSPENLEDQVAYVQVMEIDSAGNVTVQTNTIGAADMSGFYTSAQTDEKIAQAVSGLATEQYVQDALSGVNLDNYYSSAQTEEKIASAVTPVAEHLAEVEQVTASAYTELHEGLLEVSARTVPDISNFVTSAQVETQIDTKASNYTPTTGFSTINGSAITNGGNLVIQGGGGAADPTTLKSVSEFNSGASIGDVQSKITKTGLPPEITFVTGNTYGENQDQFGGTLTIPSGFASGTTDQDPVYLMSIIDSKFNILRVNVYENEWHPGGVVLDIFSVTDDYSISTIPMDPAGGEYGTYEFGTAERGQEFIANYVEDESGEGNMVVEFYAGINEYELLPYPDPVFDVPEEETEYGLYAKTDDEWKNLTPNDVVRSSYINYMWKGTQGQYNAITTKDPNTFYIIVSNYDKLILTFESGSQTAITLSSSAIGSYEYDYLHIKSVEVPEIVEEIGDYAFCDNSYLESITLNEGLQVIQGQAFQHGIYSSITIPSTVTEIGTNAFNIKDEQDMDEAGNLTITCLATTPPTLNDEEGITFGDPTKITAIYVPSGSVSDYQTEWSDYASLITAIQN